MKLILRTYLLALCLGLACLLVACSDDKEDEGIADATLALSLEVNEDGSDSSATDVLEEEPLLLKGCGLSLVESHLRESFDANASGELEPEERRALRENFGAEIEPRPLFEGRDGEGGAPAEPPFEGTSRGRVRHHRMELLARIYDVDDSGRLDERERAVLAADLEVRCENRTRLLLDEFDVDEDGNLDLTEWKLAHEAIRTRFEARHDAFVAEFDLDEDGALDAEERKLAAAAIRARLDEKRAEDLELFDLDGDGKLSETEKVALVLELRARVRGEYLGNAPSEVPL